MTAYPQYPRWGYRSACGSGRVSVYAGRLWKITIASGPANEKYVQIFYRPYPRRRSTGDGWLHLLDEDIGSFPRPDYRSQASIHGYWQRLRDEVDRVASRLPDFLMESLL